MVHGRRSIAFPIYQFARGNVLNAHCHGPWTMDHGHFSLQPPHHGIIDEIIKVLGLVGSPFVVFKEVYIVVQAGPHKVVFGLFGHVQAHDPAALVLNIIPPFLIITIV